MSTFPSFDGACIHYHGEGSGPAVVLLHGYGLDALGSWGPFDYSKPLIQLNLEMFRVANQKTGRLLEALHQARLGTCEGDHYSTCFQPSFEREVRGFLEQRWP